MHSSRFNLIFDTHRDGSFLILNTLSGAMDVVERRAVSFLQHPDDQEAQKAFPEFFRYAHERGYLYDTAADESATLRAFREKANSLYKSEPFRAQVYPTFLCNLRCTYCFQPHLFHRRNSIMLPEVIEALFRTISEFHRRWGNPAPPVLTLFGGEPLLTRPVQREAIASILAASAAKNYRTRIITNGVELAAYSELLAKYPPEFIQVTLDGPRSVHDRRRIFANGQGSFDRIVEGIDSALEKGLHIAIRVNIDVANVRFLPDLADFILERGWLDKGAAVGVVPVDEAVPETEWCAEQTKIETLRSLLEVRKEHKQVACMSINYRLARFFEHVVNNGALPFPTFKYCPAAIGNEISLDYLGNIFACC